MHQFARDGPDTVDRRPEQQVIIRPLLTDSWAFSNVVFDPHEKQ